LPTLATFQPILAREGVQISFSELLKRFLDLIGVDGADRVFTRIDPAQAAMLGGGAPAPGSPSASDMVGAGVPAGPPNGDTPTPLVEDGGPMGPHPTDANALAQLLQLQAQGAFGPPVDRS